MPKFQNLSLNGVARIEKHTNIHIFERTNKQVNKHDTDHSLYLKYFFVVTDRYNIWSHFPGTIKNDRDSSLFSLLIYLQLMI